MSEPKIIKESIVARSPKGQAVLTFENKHAAETHLARIPGHSLKLFKQIITEEELVLS